VATQASRRGELGKTNFARGHAWLVCVRGHSTSCFCATTSCTAARPLKRLCESTGAVSTTTGSSLALVLASPTVHTRLLLLLNFVVSISVRKIYGHEFVVGALGAFFALRFSFAHIDSEPLITWFACGLSARGCCFSRPTRFTSHSIGTFLSVADGTSETLGPLQITVFWRQPIISRRTRF